jgi:hypothetical protein
MKRLIPMALLLLPVLAFANGATEEHGTKGGLPFFKATESLQRQGKVIKVDSKLRDVTVVIAVGDTVILTCGPEVKNFPQIKVGDTVKAKYTETLTVHVEATGTPAVTEQVSSSEAKPGEKPHGAETNRVQFSATITAIDKAKGTVTLKGYRGNEYELTPQVKENLDKVKVGQLVVFTYDEAIAVSCETVKPAAKPAGKSTTKK